MCAKFGTEISRGDDFTGGLIFGFPIDSYMGLLGYCTAAITANDVILIFSYLLSMSSPLDYLYLLLL